MLHLYNVSYVAFYKHNNRYKNKGTSTSGRRCLGTRVVYKNKLLNLTHRGIQNGIFPYFSSGIIVLVCVCGNKFDVVCCTTDADRCIYQRQSYNWRMIEISFCPYTIRSNNILNIIIVNSRRCSVDRKRNRVKLFFRGLTNKNHYCFNQSSDIDEL